jgi:hypothetical protein
MISKISNRNRAQHPLYNEFHPHPLLNSLQRRSCTALSSYPLFSSQHLRGAQHPCHPTCRKILAEMITGGFTRALGCVHPPSCSGIRIARLATFWIQQRLVKSLPFWEVAALIGWHVRATPPKLPSEPITMLPAVRGFSSP